MIYLDLDKPTTKKDFQLLATCIRNSTETRTTEKLEFNASGFIVRCYNSPDCKEWLARKLEQGKTVKATPKLFTKPRLPSWEAVLKRNKDDKENYYELLGLFNEQNQPQKSN